MYSVNEGGTLSTVTRSVGRNLGRSVTKVSYEHVQTVTELRSLGQLFPPWQPFLEAVELNLYLLEEGRHHGDDEGGV